MKIKGYTKITNERHLNLFSISYLDRKNCSRSWRIVSRQESPKAVSGALDRPDAVVVVPYHAEKEKMVLISEYRVALGGFQYGFPAGLIDAGESVTEAGIRELREETGLIATQILMEGAPVYSSTGMTDESVSMLYVVCGGEPSNALNESSEDIQTLFVSPGEAASLVVNREHRFDVKTWLVLSFFSAHGKLALPLPFSPK